jgi:undecaprenyl pyrophosphate synthase
MNKRIRELAADARGQMVVLTTVDDEQWRQHEEFVEKFAELIVKECLRQVEEQYKPVLEDAVMMKDTHWDGYVQCGVDSYVAIREHFFGVEE